MCSFIKFDNDKTDIKNTYSLFKIKNENSIYKYI